MLLKKTMLTRWAAWIGGALALLLAAGASSTAPWDIKNNAPPFIRHDLTVSYCELCDYSYVTIIIFNSYDGVAMTVMWAVENLGHSGLTLDPSALTRVTYRVDGGPQLVGLGPSFSGSSGPILTCTSICIPALGSLEYHPGNNQSNTIYAPAANNVVFPGSSPSLVARNNIVDFIVTGDFEACTSNCPWENTCKGHANSSVYLGGKIRTCG
jgi:hypothetical protein